MEMEIDMKMDFFYRNGK